MRFSLLALLLLAPPVRAADIDFGRDVLPILSDACFHCHGPDEKSRKAKLRLDEKDAALEAVKSGELLRRVTSTDADEVMPPPKLKRPLTSAQIDTLKKWVAGGAKWGQHWSFEAVAKPAVPEGRNAIDHFIRSRLEREKLSPSPPADRATLIRRATFDLTGLPPTPAEIDAFLADKSANAYEKVLDRLLASPRFGERMASEWLDTARYADTHGYQMDRTRSVWPYRDWVIAAFNRNLPFDDFITWQLAGDLLPNASKEQRLATAFNRLHMQNEEGGIVEEEFRVAYVIDRVNTFGTAFLGMTFECSRCHDHKYDPISMKDVYSLFAFFQNIDESGQTSYFTASMPVPTLMLSTDVQDKRIAELRAVVKAKEDAVAASIKAAQDDLVRWKAPQVDFPRPGLVAHFTFEELKDGKFVNAANAKQPGNSVENPKLAAGAIELSGENGATFPGVGHFTRSDPFAIDIRLKASTLAPRAVVLHHSMAPIDAGSRGYELLLEDGRVAFGLHHMWPGNSVKVTTKAKIAANEWARVTVTHDGSGRAAGLTVYIDGKPADVDVVRDKLTKDITYGSEPNLALGHRFRDNGFKGGSVDDLKVYDRALTRVEIDPSTKAWRDYFLSAVHKPTIAAREDLRLARRELAKFIEPIPEIMVMDELPTPKPAFILKRGAYDSRGEKVSADTPKVMPPFPADLPRNRLGLAKWLTHPDHPLTARVTVNRMWQMMFGRGLVETADNFGTQGARPTQPELLDWLSRDFVARKWDTKAILKMLAMSATYQQSSKASPELLQRDPSNDLLARGPQKRLTAEMLRDQALAASGLLVEKVGGPSVKPYQPPGLWEEIAMGKPRYDQGKGDDLYRRSLYTFWKRTVPPPSMMTLDAADRSYCVVKRQATATPLSALVVLNDPQFVEAARFLGERMLKEGGKTTGERVGFGFRLVTGRVPTEKERDVLVKLFGEQRAVFEKDAAAAKQLLAVGEKKADASLKVADHAAAAVVGNMLLSLNEASLRR